MMKFGEKIYQLRTKKNMTQEVVAEKIGVTRQSVSKWESGATLPELEKIKGLAALFEVPVGELIEEEPAEKEPAETGEETSESEEQEGAELSMKGGEFRDGPEAKLRRLTVLSIANSVVCLVLVIALVVMGGTFIADHI